MRYRQLGKTGLRVSAISVGTVSLGTPYGIKVPGDFGCPDAASAKRLIQSAAEAGVNLFDTAPAYGTAERLLGEALIPFPDVLIAGKVAIPRIAGVGSASFRKQILTSLEKSLKSLKRTAIDILQIHNATEEVLREGAMLAVLEEARRQGKVRFLGTTVYEEAAAHLSVAEPALEVVQIAFNIFDQRMQDRLLPAAQHSGPGVLVRSAFLKGVLTPKARSLPNSMDFLKTAVDRLRETLGLNWEELPELALRFCLTVPGVSTVLAGIRTSRDLSSALHSLRAGPLPDELFQQLSAFALDDPVWLNPSRWPFA